MDVQRLPGGRDLRAVQRLFPGIGSHRSRRVLLPLSGRRLLVSASDILKPVLFHWPICYRAIHRNPTCHEHSFHYSLQ